MADSFCWKSWGSPVHHTLFCASQIMLEAKGFEGFLGGGTEVEDEYEIMAGMSAVLLDVQLRPVTFFQGYTDLMSKFFSSSGEPTNVAKGNILLMDHQQV